MHFFLVIVLSLHVGYSLTTLDSSPKSGSHNLFKLEKSNNSLQRPQRCTPCESETNLKRPVSNHLDPEYRGNGADNLGYDWSPMAWGGPAFPRKPKVYMGGMRGGKMMPSDGGRGGQGGQIQIICDTCRAYWSGDRRGGGSSGRGGSRGRQLDMSGGQNYYGDQPGYWQGNKMMRMPEDYETRVMSPTVGVLVKPGSRIAYIPSRSGEMFWDGVSGGGTRWDGFSNGISWIGNAPEWDRSDSDPRDGAGEDSLRRGGNPYGSNGFGPWDGQKRPSNWGDNSGRGYYFSNGVSNDVDPQWRDRGYASNWRYGSTNQDGWNGSNMKWNYGGKQWTDNDRAANRFYFNSPQDRTYGPSDRQYGNQYPNYQTGGGGGGGYPASFRPQPMRPAGGGYRPNDRFPGNFQQGGGDKDRPWDYTSRDPFGYQRPRPRPEWMRPGPSYPAPGNQVDNYGKGSGPYRGYDKLTPSDKNDYEKPWSRPSGYGPSQPGPAGGFPYGGNRYPEEPSGSGGGGGSGFPAGGGHLFFPNEGNRQPNYPNIGSGSGEIRPTYPGGNRKPGGYPGNQIGTFSGDGGRPSSEYPGDKRPSVIYTGGRPSGYPSSGSLSGGYPSTENSLGGGYPSDGGLGGTYPGGSRPTGYPGPSSGYPTGGSYPESGGRPSGFTGGRPDNYGGGDSSVGYPGGSGSSYPQPGGALGGGGSSYPRPDGPSGGGSSSYPRPGVPSGSGGSSYPRPDGPSGGGGSSYPRPDGPSGGSGSSYPQPGGASGGGGSSYPRPDGPSGAGGSSYPRPGGSSYPQPGGPSGGGGSYPSGSSRPGFYPNEGYLSSGSFGGGRPTGYPGDGRPGGGYPGEGNRPGGYPSGSRPNYPVRGPALYPGTGSGGNKNPPKGYYLGFITELSPDDGQSQYGTRYPSYFGSSYPGKDRDRYFGGGSPTNGYTFGDKNRYPGYSEDRYSGGGGGGGGGGGYPSGGNDRGGDKYYYGQSDGKGKYPGGYPSNHRYPNGGTDEFDRNQGSTNDKNSWNYGENEHKDGIYRRSGGSYPPYRGGQYYTSSYLASMSTTGSTQAGTEPKTQSVTKADEVTQPTPDSP